MRAQRHAGACSSCRHQHHHHSDFAKWPKQKRGLQSRVHHVWQPVGHCSNSNSNSRQLSPPSSRDVCVQGHSTNHGRQHMPAIPAQEQPAPVLNSPAGPQTLPGRDAQSGTNLQRRLILLGGAATAGLAGRLWLPTSARAADTPTTGLGLGFEERVSEFTLSNGLHFIVLERHEAPVVSCMVHANVGAFDEEEGLTGMAHLLEHMAFKGTSEIGSRDWKREEPLLNALDEVFYELRSAKDAAQQSGSTSSDAAATINRLEAKLASLQDQAAQLSIPNAFGSLLQQEGAVGLNAATSQDETKYFMSLPSNKLELWFALEARRFQDPVFRELYSEKRVVAEERRLRLESSPMGKYQQQYIYRSLGNNYRRPVIGFAEDVDRMGRDEVFSFFRRYYGPTNITIAIVGDVAPERVRRLAETYFGAWDTEAAPDGQTGSFVQLPAGAELATLAATEQLPYPIATNPANSTPTNNNGAGGVSPASASAVSPSSIAGADRLYRQASEAGPFCMLGFYRPSLTAPDGVVVKVLTDILAAGRTSRLVSKLVLEERRLLVASADPGFTGEKHAGLSLVYGRPTEGYKPEDADRLLRRELDLLIEQGPSQSELARVTKGSRAGLYGVLQSNRGMAEALSSYHVLTGSWRGMLTEIESLAELSPDRCQQVAAQVFSSDNCYRGYIDPLRGAANTA